MKIGQRVRLLGFYSKIPDKYNPRDCYGVVKSLDGQYSPIIVLWDNGYQNSYSEKDLEKVFRGGSLVSGNIETSNKLKQTSTSLLIDDFEE